MRHRKSGRRLGRNSSHRKAMFRNMASSMVKHETIRTTVPKAKELRRVVEPLITLAKEDSVANRRLAFDRLRDKEAVGKLFSELGPRFKDRPGGYLRILKMGPRPGDAAPMAILELVKQSMIELIQTEAYGHIHVKAVAAPESESNGNCCTSCPARRLAGALAMSRSRNRITKAGIIQRSLMIMNVTMSNAH